MLRELATVTAVSGLAGGVFGIAPPAQAATTTLHACVKKKTGQIRFVKPTKKCKKGWKRVTWNTTGPDWVVKDRNGTTLGRFSGYYATGLVPELVVTADDGGIFRYGMDGILDNDNGFLNFRDAACTQAAVFDPVAANLQKYVRAAGGAGRAVFQVTGAPVASAYRVDSATTASAAVAANSLFEKNSTTGVCTPAMHPAGFIVPLADAAPPVIATPPLSVVTP